MNAQGIDGGNDFDFGRTSEMYAKYRDIYPPELYERLLALGVGQAGTPRPLRPDYRRHQVAAAQDYPPSDKAVGKDIAGNPKDMSRL